MTLSGPKFDVVTLAESLLAARKSLYLGTDSKGPLFGDAEDQLLVMGPPRSGKSSGLFSPSIACHPGPVIVASIRHDLTEDTRSARELIARRRGGSVSEVHLAGTAVMDQDSPGWPVSDGCADWSIAKDRAISLAYTAVPPADGDTFWRQSVATAMAGCLHGAALLGHSDLQLSSNIRMANLEIYRNAVGVLDPDGTHPSTHSFAWIHNDRVMAENTRKSLLAVLGAQVLGAFDYGETAPVSQVRLHEFVKGWGTLYITVPYERKDILSPLVTAFIESVIAVWRKKYRQRDTQSGTLLLALDEVANIAPLPSLPGILTTGSGDGIQTVMALHNPAHADIWKDQAATVLGSSSHLALFPGLRAPEYIEGLASASEKIMVHTPVVSVSKNLPGGDRYVTAERLVQERLFMEERLMERPETHKRMARLEAASVIAGKRHQDRLWTRPDGITTVHGVLEELMRYTDVSLDRERRSAVEPSDLTHRKRGEITLFHGAKAHFLKVSRWQLDPFWGPLMDES